MNTTFPFILIVDDDQDFCTIMRNELVDICPILTANNLLEATERMEEVTPSVMILDNHLPDGLGAMFVDECKHDYPEVKVIMVCADTDPRIKSTAIEAGVEAFLLKPFDIGTLRKSVVKAMNLA